MDPDSARAAWLDEAGNKSDEPEVFLIRGARNIGATSFIQKHWRFIMRKSYMLYPAVALALVVAASATAVAQRPGGPGRGDVLASRTPVDRVR